MKERANICLRNKSNRHLLSIQTKNNLNKKSKELGQRLKIKETKRRKTEQVFKISSLGMIARRRIK